ncbi:MAG TPA: hypothetical protein VEX38_03860 [Fimbriimonadaceae bacterium]|nr:hypothetical protein [Fimbriimonadaceae bacterium]
MLATEDRADLCVSILHSLPEITAAATPEEHGRAFLRPLLHRMVRFLGSGEQTEPVAPDSSVCPNCDAPTDASRSPYCSVQCRQVSGYVRRFRAAIEDGSIEQTTRQEALGGFLWGLHGGYPLRQKLVPPRVLAKVIERCGGVCAVCGEPATEVEHAPRADGGSG